MVRLGTNPGRTAQLRRRNQPAEVKRGRKIQSPARTRWGAAQLSDGGYPFLQEFSGLRSHPPTNNRDAHRDVPHLA